MPFKPSHYGDSATENKGRKCENKISKAASVVHGTMDSHRCTLFRFKHPAETYLADIDDKDALRNSSGDPPRLLLALRRYRTWQRKPTQCSSLFARVHAEARIALPKPCAAARLRTGNTAIAGADALEE